MVIYSKFTSATSVGAVEQLLTVEFSMYTWLMYTRVSLASGHNTGNVLLKIKNDFCVAVDKEDIQL